MEEAASRVHPVSALVMILNCSFASFYHWGKLDKEGVPGISVFFQLKSLKKRPQILHCEATTALSLCRDVWSASWALWGELE